MKRRNVMVFVLLMMCLLCFGCTEKAEEDEEYYPSERELFQMNYQSDVLIYNGDGEVFPEDFPYREITSVGKESLSVKQEDCYGCVIILDRKGNCQMSKEELLELKEFSETNRYDIMYYGTAQLDTFVELKFEKNVHEKDAGMFYFVSDTDEKEYNAAGNPYACHGVWTTEDEESAKEDPEYFQWQLYSELLYNAQRAEKYQTEKLQK